jgi:hypothetical protein
VADDVAAVSPERLEVTVGSGRDERSRANTFQLTVRIVGQSVPTNVHRAMEIA